MLRWIYKTAFYQVCLTLLVGFFPILSLGQAQCIELLNKAKSLKERQSKVQSTSFAVISDRFSVSIENRSPNIDDATGDFYKFIPLSRGKIALFLGDFEGHGNQSASGTLELHKYLAGKKNTLHKPSQWIKKIDQEMTFDKKHLVLQSVIIDPKTGRLEYASAGMPPIYILKRDGSIEVLSESQFAYVGTKDMATFSYSSNNNGSHEYQLEKGDRVILASDGVMDAFLAHKHGGKSSIEDFKFFLKAQNHPINSPQPIEIQSLNNSILKETQTSTDDRTIIIYEWLP